MTNERDDELKREIEDHLELETADRQADGLSAEEARHAAQRAFGSVLRATEDTRAVWSPIALEQTWQDVRHALRSLVRQPMFAAAAVTTLALSIGVSTAIFSIVEAALLRPLPYPDPERLVAVYSVNRSQEVAPTIVSPADYRDWRAQARSLEHLAAYSGSDFMPLAPGERLEPIGMARVTWNFFHTLGTQPLLGRSFEESVETAGFTPGLSQIVMSHRLWQTRFGGDPGIIGKRIRSAQGSAVVIGVMPPEFRFPDYAEVWTPMGCCGEIERRVPRYWRVVGRLRSGQAVEAAQDDLAAVAARLAQTYPNENQNWSVEVVPLADAIVGNVRRPLWLLMGAVAFIVVIGCANVAGLVLVRSTARRRELGVRVALGASRARLVRQLLAEGLLVSMAGTVGGLLVAKWGISTFFTLLPDTTWTPLIQFRDEVQMNGAVLAFTLALSFVTTVVLTLAPVTDSIGSAVAQSVRTAHVTGRNRRDNRAYRLLVGGQFACAIVLLAGAGLLMQSFVRMQRVARGFDPASLVVMGLPIAGKDPQLFVDEAIERIRSSPAIESVAVKNGPRFGELNFPINFEHRPLTGDVVVRYNSVTADYFRVLKARLVAGRTFDTRDAPDAPRVVVINETLRRQYFSTDDPVGRRIVLAYNNQRIPLDIIGVVGDMRHDAPGEPLPAQVFVPWPQAPWISASIVARGYGDPASVQSALRDAISSLDKNLPVSPARTLEEILDSQVATPRLYTTLLIVFAAGAVGLAALGIYGLFAYVVGRRTNEIAIRMALGGQRSGIIRMVVGEGLRLSLMGISIGLLGTIALARVLRGLLFEVSPNDPITFGAVVTVLAAVAVVACYVPAHRAARTNPIVALRRE
jgi:predicted permease